jgi:nicotinamide-nucleotide amidase
MGAEILTIGTELLLGQIVDTNASWIAQRLAEAGIDLFYKTTVGDNAARIEAAFRQALSRADVIIATGGLGPTEDDLTRDVVAAVLGRPLRLDPAVLAHIERRFAHRKIPMPDNNRKQAMVPEGAEVLPNPNGTAPGLFLKDRGRCIALLPGVPAEMKPLLTEQVIPRVRDAFGIGSRIVSRILKTCGISESKVDQAIGDYFREMRNPTIGVLAHAGEIHIRMTCKGDDPATITRLLDDLEGKIRGRLGPLIFGRDEEKLEALVGQLLRGRGATLAVAESCTGGLLASRLTDIPGSSEYFERGVVAYSTDAKEEILAVPPQLLRDFGTVSLEVARAMADGARRLSGTSFGLAITGIAGPTGGTPEKPVGLVCIALAWEGGHVEREYRLHGGRELIKYRASQMALEMLRRHLLSVPITES